MMFSLHTFRRRQFFFAFNIMEITSLLNFCNQFSIKSKLNVLTVVSYLA